MEKWLKDISPIMDVEHDCILSKQGDISVVFRVILPEIFTQSAENYEGLHQALVKAIKVLPAGTVLHKQDWFTRGIYQADFEQTEDNFLSQASERFFNERPFLEHDCYIILTKMPTNRKQSSSLLSSLIRPRLVPEQTIQRQALLDFSESAGQFQRILSDAGIGLLRVQEEDLLSDPKKKGLIERYCSLSGEGEALLVKDIEFREGIQIGDRHCQLYSLADTADLPAQYSPRINYEKYSTDRHKYAIGFAASLGLLLPCDHIYNQYIIVGDAQATIKKMESKRLRLQSLSTYSRENAIARDAVNDFLNECIGEQRLPVKAHFNLLLWTEEKEQLKELKKLVTSALSKMEAAAKLETAGTAQIFWAGIPGNAGDFPMNDSFDTFAEQACCFLNLETNYRSSDSTFGLRLVDRLSGRPIWVDLSDEPMRKGIISNRNKCVFGGSGSGKSMLMNHLMRAYYESGAHCVIVDVGHSYAGLCQLVNGYYFTYNEKSPICFNPFFIGEGDALDTEKKESIKTLLVALWKKDDESFRRSEYVALSNALHLYFEYLKSRSNIFPCFNSFYEFLKDEYIGVLEKEQVKEKDFDAGNFLYVLRPYYKGGEFDYLLNATERLDSFQQRFIVFELDNIKDHPILFPVVTLIIMELFISKMRKFKGIRKVITIEEAWKAIAKAGMAEFLKYLYKTVRKFFGEAIVVSQELDDVISSPIVKEAILNNADCKILLDMRKFQNKFEQIQSTMGMPDMGKSMVLSLNKANDPNRKYRELYVELGGQLLKVYGYEPSPEEYWAYTTEEKEKVIIVEYARRHGSYQKGIAAFLKEQQNVHSDVGKNSG
ncbi:TraG family conjugative transposon ATPase [soil metagenome]